MGWSKVDGEVSLERKRVCVDERCRRVPGWGGVTMKARCKADVFLQLRHSPAKETPALSDITRTVALEMMECNPSNLFFSRRDVRVHARVEG